VRALEGRERPRPLARRLGHDHQQAREPPWGVSGQVDLRAAVRSQRSGPAAREDVEPERGARMPLGARSHGAVLGMPPPRVTAAAGVTVERWG